MNIYQQARILLEGSQLEDKLYPIRYNKEKDNPKSLETEDLPKLPGRNKKISFSEQQIKFPSKNRMATDEGAALALHFFGNHELLAIEMMAFAILKFPLPGEEGQRIRQGLISTIRDEQKHFQLYVKRMNELGVEFGDFPLNDFFWRQVHDCPDIQSFYALVALTFESANLDFAAYYRDLFLGFEDEKTSDILEIVLEDELRHVNIGWNVLQNSLVQRAIKDQSMWDYYSSLLPDKITPARAKGNVFLKDLRIKSGMSPEFADDLEQYRGQFSVTKRKSWD